MSKSISCVVPVYNEGEYLAEQINYLHNQLENEFDNFELILVDDGSKDLSGTIIDEIASNHGNVNALHNGVNLNMGISVQRGFVSSSKEYVTYNAVDLPFDPKEYRTLIDKMENEKIDMLVVERQEYLGTSIWRRITSKINRGFMGLFFPRLKKGIKDLNYLFIVRREHVKTIIPLAKSPIFTWPEMIFRARIAGLNVQTQTMIYEPKVVRKGAFGKPHDIMWGIYEMLRFRVRLWKKKI